MPTGDAAALLPQAEIGSAGLVIAWFEFFWRHCL
jgi:hypothetical protein